MLRKPAKLARLVGGLVEGSPLPVSVKIRLSPAGNKDVNALEHIEALAALDHKPAFVTLHARTATQRYGRAATWEDVAACARKAGGNFPVLGNGDVLTPEARRKRAVAPTAAGLMVGRGALVSLALRRYPERGAGCRPRGMSESTSWWRATGTRLSWHN